MSATTFTRNAESAREDLGSAVGVVERDEIPVYLTRTRVDHEQIDLLLGDNETFKSAMNDLRQELLAANTVIDLQKEQLEAEKKLSSERFKDAAWARELTEKIDEIDRHYAEKNWTELMECGSVIVNYAIRDWAILPGSGTFEYLGQTVNRSPVEDCKSATMYRLEIVNNG